MDPYLNVDPGTMSPFQHGEVFVTDDGAETDLDLGHYERFTNISSKQSDNITTGKIYSDVIKKERQGGYLGKTVQVIPHITDRIKKFISKDISNEDFVICEIGGTVGDIESLPFLEAIRQFSNDHGRSRTLFVHLTLVPFMKSSDEIKTKPTQHSVKELRSIGIQPDIVICRSEQHIPLEQRKKISLFCNVDIENVIETVDVRTIYEAPISFYNQKLDKQVLKYFKIKSKKKPNLNPWRNITSTVLKNNKVIDIGIIGKYVNLKDAYKSLDEALTHGGIANNVKVNLVRIESDKLKKNEISKKLRSVSGILIPGGFGKRGTEGKIAAIKYAREKKIPFFGICFGMQMAIIEFARNKLNIKKIDNIIFAYEPRWAIGAGRIPKSSELRKNFKDINNIINKLKKNQKYKIIYGGSVNSKNVLELKKINDLKGFLIGSASLRAKNFIDIIKKSTN